MLSLSFIATMLFALGVAPASSSTPSNSQQFRSDPYAILRVDPQCTQKDIQRSYRRMCLKHHPDKTRSEEGENRGKGKVDADFAFKEVQHAYSLVGTEEDRRRYDLRRNSPFQFPTGANNHHAFSGYAANHGFSGYAANPSTSNRQYRRFGGTANAFDPSTIYFTVGDGLSFRFGNGRNHNVFPSRWKHRQEGRPHYVQKLRVPLAMLYSGGSMSFESKLKESISGRYCAAYRGGILKSAVMKGATTVLLTLCRNPRAHWLTSLFLFAVTVHTHLPPLPEKANYKTNIRRGWKGGTKLKFQETTFVLQEEKHETFTRVGDDLHARVTVSAERLRRGGTVTLPPLCEAEEPIEIELERRTEHGHTVTVKSRGWPRGGDGKEFGDLKVKICCDGS